MRLTKIKKKQNHNNKIINYYNKLLWILYINFNLFARTSDNFFFTSIYVYASSLHLNYIHIPLFIMGTLSKLFTTQNWFE